jgi:hypothetical protein
MKAVVINYSGNVGKTTVSRHLLSPRINNAQVFTVESINSDGTEDQIVRGKHFAEMLETLANLDDAVIDVGASNVEDFVGLMAKYRGSHEDFDYFIVPTVAKDKQQSDTISVIEALAELGVPAKKMRVVFNMVEYDEMPERIFSGLIGYHAKNKNFTLKPDAIIRGSVHIAAISATSTIHIPNQPKTVLLLRKGSFTQQIFRLHSSVGGELHKPVV